MSFRRVKKIAAVAMGTLIPVIGSIAIVGGTASALPANTLYVSVGGSDVGTCSTPTTSCATIDYAIGQAVPGDTVKVAAGTYHQTVQIQKAIRLQGAGEHTTIVDGTGLDPGGSFYGVLYVGTTGGASSVSGFTFTNPFPYAFTGGEPEVVALKDQSPSDSVAITKNIISEGSSDANADMDFPIGIDTFLNSATTTLSHNTITGEFQGALLEDNGPVSFANNKVNQLIAVTQDATTFAGEGLFFLSDESGSLTNQNASGNKFSNYAGYGIIMQAGYSNGNCDVTPCNGSLSGTLTSNRFALGGSSGAAAIVLQSEFNGNNLTATLNTNHGFVTSPSQAISQSTTDGASLNVTQNGNRIRVRP